MAIPTKPATPNEMAIESIKELDRMRMMSIQALAMQRIRDSVASLSRETGFRERPVEAFAQAPLYIPQYQQWSNTLGKLVGLPPPTRPTQPSYRRGAAGASRFGYRGGSFQSVAGELAYLNQKSVMGPWAMNAGVFANYGEYQTYRQSLIDYQKNYEAWQQAQRTLPA